MAIQRFMRLNDLSYARFRRCSVVIEQFLRGGKVSSADQRVAPPQSQLRAMQTRQLFYEATQRRYMRVNPRSEFLCLSGNQSIRYCPQCLADCFHTPLFQFPFVQACPLHNVSLLDCCQYCGKAIATLASEPGRAQPLFSCEACGAPFARLFSLTERILFGNSDGTAVFDEAHRIVAGVCEVDVERLSEMLSLRATTSDDFCRLFSHALFAVSHPGIAKPAWLFGFDSEVSVRPDSGKTTSVPAGGVDRDKSPEKSVTIDERLSALRVAILALDEDLSAKVKTICGHSSPRILGIQIDSIRYASKEYSLVMRARDCPCCAVMCWWRAHFRSYFGFKLHSSDPTGAPRLADHAGWLGDLLPLEPEVLCSDALALFAGLAAQMWEWLTPETHRHDIAQTMYKSVSAGKELAMAGYRLRDLIEQYKRGSDALELPLLRHHLGAPELRCRFGDKSFRVSYTTAQGLEYLKSCHRLRLQGALWQGNFYWPDTSLRSAQDDRWYSELARECSLRLWHELYRNQVRMNQVGSEAARRRHAFAEPV